MDAFIDAADPIYGTGLDGNVSLDGSSTVLGMIPVLGKYSLTRDIFCQNLTIADDVHLQPNGYRIFVKHILQMGDNSIIGFSSGYSTSGSIMQGGEIATAVLHSLGGSSATLTATAPLDIEGGSDYYKIPHQAVKGYSITASGGPFMLRGGAGGLGQPGGGVVIIAARYLSGPDGGTASIKAAATSPAGGGVILIVSTHSALPANIQTDVTGQNPGTLNYMQLV
jgi:hypothetical protein